MSFDVSGVGYEALEGLSEKRFFVALHLDEPQAILRQKTPAGLRAWLPSDGLSDTCRDGRAWRLFPTRGLDYPVGHRLHHPLGLSGLRQPLILDIHDSLVTLARDHLAGLLGDDLREVLTRYLSLMRSFRPMSKLGPPEHPAWGALEALLNYQATRIGCGVSIFPDRPPAITHGRPVDAAWHINLRPVESDVRLGTLVYLMDAAEFQSWRSPFDAAP